MSARPEQLTAEQLWCPCPPDSFALETTEELPSQVSIIGQERAIRGIEFGIGIASFGFNIFALGYAGTGRATTLRAFLDRTAEKQPVPADLIYVNNFNEPNQPRAITLPPGTAIQLRRDMDELVDDLFVEIPRSFESDDYERQREKILREMSEERNGRFSELEHKVNEQGFTLLKTPTGLGIAPVLNGQVLTPEAYQRLDAETRGGIEDRQQVLQSTMAKTMRDIRDLEKRAKRQLEQFDREIADSVVGHHIQELLKQYQHLEEVPEYLQEVHADVVSSVGEFRSQDEAGEGLAAALRSSEREAFPKRYKINVLVDHSQQSGAPVIIEPNPTHGNLLGRIEHRAEFGALVTDFGMIKPGALHRANGGYLVVEARALLANPLAWEALKRALKNRQIRMEEIGTQFQTISTVTVEPEPVPLDIKVILVGEALTYYLLHEVDEDFRKLFKVQADFGVDFDRSPAACQDYARFVAARCHEEGLLHFDARAVARIVEHGSRMADHQGKLSTRFGEVADLVREASFWAMRHGRDHTTADDVEQAIEERIYRANRAQEKTLELIREGTVRVDVEGQAVGQVNGLSVLSLGNYSFGKPTRITARTFTGKDGVVSVEREAKLSGRIYNKGVLTLTGYLGGKYAQKTPLSLSASVSFEQTYDEIEGDSASSAELYALLSSLSELPIKQGIAVTGSVDQHGNIQPIGGVNQKIEGFFEVCLQRGLNGEQGVLIPQQNRRNLMLRAQVRQAVERGEFHIYPVDSLDDGLEILTGVTAGQMQEDGSYPSGTLHARVLDRLAMIARHLQRSPDDEGEADKRDSTPAATASETSLADR